MAKGICWKEEREWQMLPYKKKMQILAAEEAALKEILEPSSLETDTRSKPSRSNRDKQAHKAKSLPKRNAQRQKARAELAAKFVADVDRVFFHKGADKIKRQEDFWQWTRKNKQSVEVHLNTTNYHGLCKFCVDAWWAMWETHGCPKLKGSNNGAIIRDTDDFIASLDLDRINVDMIYGDEVKNIVIRERHPDSHLYMGTLFDE